MTNTLAGSEFTGVDAAKRLNISDIEAAADRIRPHIFRTPLLESPILNDLLGFRLLVKAENLQQTGSFKLRGASNAIWSLDDTVSDVIAYSSGNHAQGVARAAQKRGLGATIVMPADSPSVKLEGTKAYGAKVVTYDRQSESREDIGTRIAADTGAVLIRPFEDTRIIAGQGTMGIEIAEQCEELGATPDHFICCCGGGGLLAGTSIALKARFPSISVWAAEPEGYDDTIRSLACGERQSNDISVPSICDAIVTPTPGEMTFSINKQHVSGGFAISEDLALRTMSAAFKYLRLVSEPGGAVALAAALDKRLPKDTTCAVVVISGGNVDASMFNRALALDPVI